MKLKINIRRFNGINGSRIGKMTNKNKPSRKEIRERVRGIVGAFREKYGTDSSVSGLKTIVEQELNIPCRGFSMYELFAPFCFVDKDEKPLGISYYQGNSTYSRFNLAHEIGHLFFERGDEFSVDEFATQITGISKWKVGLLRIVEPIIYFNPIKIILDTKKGEHRKYYLSFVEKLGEAK